MKLPRGEAIVLSKDDHSATPAFLTELTEAAADAQQARGGAACSPAFSACRRPRWLHDFVLQAPSLQLKHPNDQRYVPGYATWHGL